MGLDERLVILINKDLKKIVQRKCLNKNRSVGEYVRDLIVKDIKGNK